MANSLTTIGIGNQQMQAATVSRLEELHRSGLLSPHIDQGYKAAWKGHCTNESVK